MKDKEFKDMDGALVKCIKCKGSGGVPIREGSLLLKKCDACRGKGTLRVRVKEVHPENPFSIFQPRSK